MQLVRKANDLIEAKYSLTKNEQRLMLYAVSMIGPNDEDFKEYVLTFDNLSNLTGISKTRVYAEGLLMIQNLKSKPITFHLGHNKRLVCNWLSDIEIDGDQNKVIFSISPKMKPYLLQLKKCFTSYNLENIVGFESKYGFRIYELLKQYEKIGERKFLIDELKSILELESKYKIITDFKNYVINTSLNDINKRSDLFVEVFYKKIRRKITYVVFKIRLKKDPMPAPERIQDTNKLSFDKTESLRVENARQEWESLGEAKKAKYGTGPLGFVKFMAEHVDSSNDGCKS